MTKRAYVSFVFFKTGETASIYFLKIIIYFILF